VEVLLGMVFVIHEHGIRRFFGRIKEGAWIFELWWRNLPGAGGTLNTKVFKPPPLTREPGGGYLRA
jgi:hypothetical protein